MFGRPLRCHTPAAVTCLLLLCHPQPLQRGIDTPFLSKAGRVSRQALAAISSKDVAIHLLRGLLSSISPGGQPLSPVQAREAVSSAGRCRHFLTEAALSPSAGPDSCYRHWHPSPQHSTACHLPGKMRALISSGGAHSLSLWCQAPANSPSGDQRAPALALRYLCACPMTCVPAR